MGVRARRDPRIVGLWLLGAAMALAVVYPSPAAAADATPHVTLGPVGALIGPNPTNAGSFDVDAFHQLSATDVFNNLTFEPKLPEPVFNPPAGAGPACSNRVGVSPTTRPMTAIARQADGTCQTIPVEGTAVNGQSLQAGVDPLQAFVAQYLMTVDVDRPGVATFTVHSTGAWLMGMSSPPLASGSNPPAELVRGPNVGVPPLTGGGSPTLGGRNTTTTSASASPVEIRFPVAGTYTMEVDFAAQAATPPSFVLEVGAPAAAAIGVVDSVRSPSDLSNAATHVATNVAVAAGLAFVVAFPSELFDSTFAEHYDEITGWFRRQRDRFRRRSADPGDEGGRRPSLAVFAGVLVVSALLYSLLDPGFGLDRNSAVLFAGLLVALVVSTLVFALPAVGVMRIRRHEWGRPVAFIGALPIAAACVVLSRLAHFQPGYLYGAILGIGFASELSSAEEGKTVAVTALWTLLVSIGAWVARSPVHTAATRPGAGMAVQIADAALASIVVVGLEGVVIGLLPMQFMDGARLKQWSRRIWLAMFGVALFAFVHILLNPTSGYVASTSRDALVTTLIVFAAFGLVSVAFWAFFRLRSGSRAPAA